MRDAASSSAAGAALLESLRLVELRAGVAVIEPTDKAQLTRARNRRAWLTELLGAAAGAAVRVELREPTPAEPEQASAPDDPALRRRAEDDPVVRRAMELFDARVVRIEPAPHTPEES